MSDANSMKFCEFDGCGRPAKRSGLCAAHEYQRKNGGELRPISSYKKRGEPFPPCSFAGCDRPMKIKGLCIAHSMQQRDGKELTPLYSKNRPKGTPPRIEYDEMPCPRQDLEGPCKIIRGHKTEKGYTRICVNRKNVFAHRYVWQQVNGKVPDGLMIDHQCRNKSCINLNHLRLVTPKVNVNENIVRKPIKQR